MAVLHYLATRFKTLKPTCVKAPSPLRMLSSLSPQQWLFFSVGFLAWSFDAFDFFSTILTLNELAVTFDESLTSISLGVTFALMSRPLGAAIFGIVADWYGRKWPFVIDNSLLIIFELATGFCQTYRQFLAVRALFGIAMGGIYGNAAATALEDCPEAAQGLFSGIYQSGYFFGYLLAAAFWAAFDSTGPGWRLLFWFSACPPVILIIIRLLIPETNVFEGRKVFRNEKWGVADVFAEAKAAVRRHWLLLLYLVFLMTGFTYMTHGTQDLYPTMLEDKYNYSSTKTTVVMVVANLGAVTGSLVIGYYSQILARRFLIVVMCLVSGALLYPYTFVSGPGLYAAAFFLQFCIGGAWGVIPIHLIELSPPAFKTFVVGTSYHLGILVSSSSLTILTTLGERYPLPPEIDVVTGETIQRFDYSLVMCIFGACVMTYVVIVTILGPERLESEEVDTEAEAGDDQDADGDKFCITG